MKTVKHAWSARNGGFTLIELMIALLIGLFLVGGIIEVMNISSQTYRAQERVADTQQDVRAAMEIMVHDIRMAGFDPARRSDAKIVTATADTISFQQDTNKSNTLDLTGEEDITYTFANGTVNRILNIGKGAPNESSTPLVTGVGNLTFTYFNQDGEPPDALGDIASVVISITCQGRSAKAGDTFERTLTSTVAIRNLAL